MAQMFEGLNLPQSSYMPPEYSQNVLEQLSLGQQRNEEESMRRFLEGINSMGRLYTGSSLRGGIQQVLGPAMERRQSLLGNVAMQGLEAQRGERLTGEERGYQSQQTQMQRDWQGQQNEMQRQLQMQMLNAQLDAQRRASKKSKSLGSALTDMTMQALPALAMGGLTGGIGALPSLLFSNMGQQSYEPPANNFVMADQPSSYYRWQP